MRRTKLASPIATLFFVVMWMALLPTLTTAGMANASAAPSITQYSVPSSNSGLFGITGGPDGNVWFTEEDVNKIGRITTSGSFAEYQVPTPDSSPCGITVGPDGNLWFTEAGGNKICKMTTSGSFTEYPIPTPDSQPWGITAGSDGNLWFTEWASDQIGRVTTSGSFAEYQVPTKRTALGGITSGPDGNLWFPEFFGDKIAKITTSGIITEYLVPTPNCTPTNAAAGPDGNVWFTESSKIGKVTPSGSITEYPIPTSSCGAWGITAGFDGNIWFTELGFNQVGKITPSGSFAEYPIPSGYSPEDITTGPDGNLWFIESEINKIGKVKINPPVPPSSEWKSTSYFAEGYTGIDFREYACLENPNATEADAWITCMFSDGTSRSQYYALDPTSRRTVDINQLAGAGRELSMRVVSTSPGIVAERPMYFNYLGRWSGGHDVMGAVAPSANWYFAEGTCRPNFDPYFCIQNPGNTAANVTLTYMKGDGTEASDQVTVAPKSRSTVSPRTKLGTGDDPAHDFSTRVACTNGQKIIAERPMYFNYLGRWSGGHDVMGAIAPSANWYFAEGTCRPNFDPYFCIQNPGNTAANVTLTYMKGDGTTKEQALVVEKNSRYTVKVTDFLGQGDDAAHDFSATIACTNRQTIIAERPMYFDYMGYTHLDWTGGHDVIGVMSPASTFCFAEGTCRPNFDPYFCIQNPGDVGANVTITYMKGDGTTKKQALVVEKNSRYTVKVTDFLGQGDDAAHDFSATVACTNGQKIIAERPMYFDYMGIWTGGHDVVGFVSTL